MATRGRSSSSHQGGATQQFLQFVERKESDVFHTTIREPETDPVLAGGNVASPHPLVGFWSDGLNPTSYQIGRVFGCLSMARNQVKLESRKD
jgi:hypothetical protein